MFIAKEPEIRRAVPGSASAGFRPMRALFFACALFRLLTVDGVLADALQRRAFCSQNGALLNRSSLFLMLFTAACMRSRVASLYLLKMRKVRQRWVTEVPSCIPMGFKRERLHAAASGVSRVKAVFSAVRSLR